MAEMALFSDCSACVYFGANVVHLVKTQDMKGRNS